MSAPAPLTRRAVRFVDQRTGSAPYLRKALRYLFPDHWSFLLGEIALYAFIVLVATGIYLTFFFVDSTKEVVYHGPYAPLDGQRMSEAYASVVRISLSVRAGLLIRQTHHWAAEVFIGAIVLHLLRVFFTGAYRKPRELTYLIGVTMLMLSLLEAYMGYSLVDDLLSGMGLVIGYSVGLSLPFVGENLMGWLFGGMFPGSSSLWPRMYIAHVLIFPLLIGGLLGAHLLLVVLRHHTQFRRRRAQTERAIAGLPAFPSQAPRSIALALATAGVLFLLGGLVEINPIWLWGPYHTYTATNGAQPDWYLGWLIGGLRLVPSFDLVIDGYTLVPNPFWGGVAFPLVVFGFLYLWPWLERKLTGDQGFHNLLERPRDAPVRTGVGVGMLTWVVVVFLAGGSDRVDVLWGIGYVAQVHVYWVLVWVLPVLFGLAAWWLCKELQASERVVHERRRAQARARLERLRRLPGDQA
ncbi:MAG TPA: cytochrome b N-terminal domain-containing protein [Gaiellaceae bacterium]|nr:cytochrome b N-terminal domain-containing protein [Gaiellaceae bacterium]